MISLTIEGIDFFVYIGVTKMQEVSIISHKKGFSITEKP
jgi:phosphate starvation-inducible membrane PsiE